MRRLIIPLLILVTLAASVTPAAGKDGDKFVLVIDPGHGGGDIGTPHRKQKLDEKDVALRVALRLGSYVQRNFKDVKIVYTRQDDVYPTLPQRAKIAREAKGDLYISIHVNSAPDKAARGFETYVFGVTGLQGKTAAEQKRLKERTQAELDNIADRENRDITGRMVDFDKDIDMETKILCQTEREKHNRYSEDAAEDIQNSLIAGIRRTSYKDKVKDRGVKRGNIFVLCYAPMPAILIELGYMSNPDEEKFINTQEGMETFAKSIYTGFTKYKRAWDKRQLPDPKKDQTRPAPTAKPAATAAPATASAAKPAASAAPAASATPAAPAAPAKPAAQATPTPAAPAASKPSETKTSGMMPLAPPYQQKTAKPAEAAKPAEPAKPAEAAKPAEPAKPAEAAKPAEPVKPAEAAKPAEPAKPAEVAKPAEPAKPAEAAKPAEPAKPAEAAKPAEPAQPAKPATSELTYRIQFLSSTKLMQDNDPAFKGLTGVHHYQDGNVYRYTYGSAPTQQGLSADLKKVRALFPDAFPVKFDSNGNRIR